MLGVDGQEPDNVIHVTPGRLEFLPPIPLTNKTGYKQLYTVRIIDEDDSYLLQPELKWVNDEFELREWIKKGFVKRPAVYEAITKVGVELR